MSRDVKIFFHIFSLRIGKVVWYNQFNPILLLTVVIVFDYVFFHATRKSFPILMIKDFRFTNERLTFLGIYSCSYGRHKKPEKILTLTLGV